MISISLPMVIAPVEKSTNSSRLIRNRYIMVSPARPAINPTGEVENLANHCENISLIKSGESSLFFGVFGSIRLFKSEILSLVRFP